MQRNSSGSVAVYVILLSMSIFVILIALLQQTSGMFTNTQERTYLQLAQEAAEAGGVYATSCLNANDHRQTWGPDYYGGGGADRPDLTPGSDCQGTANTYPSATYVYSDTRVRTYFSVGALSSDSLDNSVVISAIGYAEVLSNGTVTETYQYGIKKNISWDASVGATRSASGAEQACAIVQSSAYCWGDNTYGQLGNSTTTDSTTPVAVTRSSYPGGIGSKQVTDIVAGEYFSCLLIDTGEAYCWGRNDKGQLGQSNYADSPTPLRVQGSLAGKTITQLSTTAASVCALTSDDDMYCWGDGESGQLGNGSSGSLNVITTPTLIAGPSAVSGGGDIGTSAVSSLAESSAYTSHMCAIAGDTLYCWGENGDGELGTGDHSDKTSPTTINGGALAGLSVMSVAAEGSPGVLITDDDGSVHTCAVAYTTAASDAKVYCWGSSTYGQTGNGSTDYTTRVVSPSAVDTSGDLPSAATVTDVSATAQASCAIAYTGGDPATAQTYCWGTRDEIGAGDGVPVPNPSPVAVDDSANVLSSNATTELHASANQTCVSAVGRRYCWGANGNGQLGDTTLATPRTTPVEALYFRNNRTEYLY